MEVVMRIGVIKRVNRFVVLYLLSFGLYLFYWYYDTLKRLKVRELLDVSPGWRTVGMLVPLLNVYLLYDLFRRVNQAACSAGFARYGFPCRKAMAFYAIPLLMGVLVWLSIPSAETLLVHPYLVWLGLLALFVMSVIRFVFVAMAEETMSNYLFFSDPRAFIWERSLTAGQVAVTAIGFLSVILFFAGLHYGLIWAGSV
jgi:hypothetical protein